MSNDSSPGRSTFTRTLAERQEKRKQRDIQRTKISDELKDKGNQLFKQGKYSEALSLYEQALLRAVAFKDLIYSNMGATYLKLGLYKEADEAATRALTYDPTATKPRFRRALARKNLGRLKGAAADLKVILTLEPNCPETSAELKAVNKLSRNRSKIKDADEREIDLQIPAPLIEAPWESEIESVIVATVEMVPRVDRTTVMGVNRQAIVYSHMPQTRRVFATD